MLSGGVAARHVYGVCTVRCVECDSTHKITREDRETDGQIDG